LTTLHCDAHRIIDDGPVDGVIRISSSHVQYSQGDLVIPDFTEKEMVDGEATFTNVKPGRALVQIHWGFNSMVSIRVSIPDTDEITLSKLALQDYDLEPNIVSEVTKQATNAEKALADTQQGLDDTTIQANLATQARNRAVSAAEAANTSKQTTNSYVKTVETHIETVLGYLGDTEAARDAAKGYSESASAEASRAAEKAQAAAQSETNSANSADAATQAANDSAESSQTASGAAETASASLSEVQSIEDSLKALMADTESWNDVQYALEQVDSDIASAMESVKQEILGGVGPAYDTLQELADAFQGNQSAITALTDQIAGKAPKDHTHTPDDIEGTSTGIGYEAAGLRLVKTNSAGFFNIGGDPKLEAHPTRKKYVDRRVDEKAGKGHKHTIQDTNGLQEALDGKSPTGHEHAWGEISGKPEIPVTDVGYNTRHADDPPSDYPAGVSWAMSTGGSRGWDEAIAADVPDYEDSGFVMILTMKNPSYPMSTTQLVFSYDNEHRPVYLRKHYGTEVGWGPFRSLTDDGHTHEISEVNGLQEKLENINPDVGISDVTGLQPALQAKVEGMGIRFIQVVTRVPNPPNAETLYIVM